MPETETKPKDQPKRPDAPQPEPRETGAGRSDDDPPGGYGGNEEPNGE